MSKFYVGQRVELCGQLPDGWPLGHWYGRITHVEKDFASVRLWCGATASVHGELSRWMRPMGLPAVISAVVVFALLTAIGGLLTSLALIVLVSLYGYDNPGLMWGSYLFCCGMFFVGWWFYGHSRIENGL